MNQSTALKQPLQAPIRAQNQSNVISLREIKHQQVQARIHAAQMLKQRLLGVLLLVLGIVTTAITYDATAFIFLAIFAIPMLFSKTNMMINNKKKGKHEKEFKCTK